MQNKEARLVQSMLDASMHGIILLEPVRNHEGLIEDFVVKAANASIKSQVGFRIESNQQQLLSSYFPAYKEYYFYDLYKTALETGQLQRKELYYKDDRVEGWFDLGVAPQDDSLVVTFVNSTESKKYQQTVEKSSAQLLAIMDIVQSGIFMFFPERDERGQVIDFRFTIANRALASYVGQQPQKLIGTLGSTWFPGYKSNGLFELYKNTWESGKTNRFDFHYNADGIDVWLDIMSNKLGEEVLVTFTDYTPIKKLQLQLEELVNDLRQSNENLEEFAYAASHDLQEPLRKIHFFADQLKNRFHSLLETEGAELVERMEAAAVRMRTLIEDLLAYSSISSDRSIFEKVDTNQLAVEVLSDLEASIHEKKAVISMDELPAVNGNKLQLRQLFQNLLSNSLKYNHPQIPLRISMTTKTIKGKEAQMPLPIQEGNRLFHLIEVADNGLGFEQEHSKKIFQIFQRLHSRTEYPGTGVGLAIVQKVVDNHKGFINAESEPGKGSVFRILLPA